MTTWLASARKHDLHPGIGNGPFREFLGVILHVNVDKYGTPASFWGNGNPGQVCPNFQVFKDGSVDQMLPFNWQPWCQINGNFNYAAIETAGMPNEPLTDAQIGSIARILRIYHDEQGMPLQVANSPGERGLGIHQMGGQGWGGHSCPGTIRAGQRGRILAVAGGVSSGHKPASTKPVKVTARKWPLAKGHYFGPITGPGTVHGGYYPSERPFVRAIQLALIADGCVPGLRKGTKAASQWADGRWEQPTSEAWDRWETKHHRTRNGLCGPDDWKVIL